MTVLGHQVTEGEVSKVRAVLPRGIAAVLAGGRSGDLSGER